MVINILAIHQEMRNIHRHDHVTIFKKKHEFKVQDEDACICVAQHFWVPKKEIFLDFFTTL
jgi:hypothetical protein